MVISLAAAVQQREREDLAYRVLNAELDVALLKLFLFFFLGSIFFSGILPAAGTIRSGSLALAVAISFIRVTRKRMRIILLPAGVFLLVFLVFAVANRGEALLVGSDRSWLYTFTLTLLLGIFLRADSAQWAITIVKDIALFSVIHAAATLFFLVVPNVYSDWFKPHFYANVRTAQNYKAGLTSHYSTNGMYLAWGLISSYFLSCCAAKRRGWLVCAGFVLLALLATTKRAHLLFGIAACFSIYFLFNRNRGSVTKWFKFLTALLAAAIVMYVFSLYIPELAGVLTRLQGAELDDGRSSYYTICLDMWRRAPFFGGGWNSFTKTLYQSGISDLSRLYTNNNLSQNAHNVYLQLLAEEGLFGFVLFLLVAGGGLLRSIKSALTSCDSGAGAPQQVALSTLSVAVQMFFFLYCLTGNSLYEVAEYAVYILVGLPSARLFVSSVGAFESRELKTHGAK